MSRNLRLIIAAAMAALAMTAVFANAAPADVITAESVPATLTGVQSGSDEFTVHAGKVKCSTVKYAGTLSANGGTTVRVKPTYTGCTFVGLTSTVDAGKCEYLVHLDPAAGVTTGTVDIVGCEGTEITVTAPSPALGTAKCIVHVKEQTGLSSGTVAVVGSGTTRELELKIGITKIAYSQTAGTAGSGNCATADNTSGETGGTYTGKAIVTGASGSTHIGLFLS